MYNRVKWTNEELKAQLRLQFIVILHEKIRTQDSDMKSDKITSHSMSKESCDFYRLAK